MRPNFFSEFASLNSSNPLEKAEEKGEPDPEEHALYVISLAEGWRVLDEYITDLEKELDQSIIALMAAGASFEEIGQRTAVKEAVKIYLERIRSRVIDAREANEQE